MGAVESVLITGANGFIGNHVLRVLLKNNFKPVLLLRSSSDTWRIDDLIVSLKHSIYYLDSPSFSLSETLSNHQISGIIHLATEYGRDVALSDIIEANVVFPLRLLDTAKNQINVFINTDSFFGKRHFNQTYLKEYTASKRILEGFLESYNSNVKIVNMRLEHVYGDSDSDGKFFTSILKSLLSNQKQIRLTDGTQKRDFIYVEDVAEAYTAVLKNLDLLKDYQELEVGTGKCISVKDFVIRLAQLTSSDSYLDFGAHPKREGDIEESKADNTNLKKLGWQDKYMLEEALNLVVQKEKIRFNL